MGVRLRRPVALVAVGNRVLVGNRCSGTISVIEPSAERAVGEYSVATRIADMIAIPNSDAVFVLDDGQNRLLKVLLRDDGFTVDSATQVPSSAVKLAVSESRQRVFVNSKWSHDLTVINFDVGFERVTQSRRIALPFASHAMLLLDRQGILLIADAFGGRIAVVDAANLKLLGIRTLAGHNIRGLAVSVDGKDLFVAHQQLNPRGRADYEDLHWGRLVANGVQVFKTQEFIDDDFENRDAGELTHGWLDRFGGIGGASGDPGAVVTASHGLMAVCLSGSGEVAIRSRGSVRRISVGRRPTALAIRDGRLYVANRFDDTVSVIAIDTGTVVQTISLGKTPPLSATERGELLFFNARLSHDGWMSCHSCHTDGHSSGLLVDTLGDGDYGAPKRVPSLLGTRNTGPWAWDGSMVSLAEQIQSSVTTTMHGDRLTERQTRDLVSYLESLPAPPPVHRQQVEHVRRGQTVFKSRGCVECHARPTLTAAKTFDVGLADENGRRAFNPPSLHGVSQRGRLFHDGRATNLKDVIRRFRHQLDEPLSEVEVEALLAFLRSL
jgi:YVTN family beta-propeller protein